MALGGLAEGYLAGLQMISGLENMRENKEKWQLQRQQTQRAMQDQAQEKGILSSVFSHAADRRQGEDEAAYNSRLAQTYRKAGAALMGVDPKGALEIMREGENIGLSTARAQLERARGDLAADQYLGEVSSTVDSQEALDYARGVFAKYGRTVPKKYQTWNEDTKAYFDRMKNLGVPVQKQKELEIRLREAAVREADEKRKQEKDTADEAIKEKREARLREGQKVKERAAGEKASKELQLGSKDARENEIRVLGADDKQGKAFRDLPPGKQAEAAADVHYRAQQNYAQMIMNGDEPDKEEALRQAREDVLGEIKAGGWFAKSTRTPQRGERTGGGVESGSSGSEPTTSGRSVAYDQAFRTAAPMPSSKDALKRGQAYRTARGLAIWNGEQFESVE